MGLKTILDDIKEDCAAFGVHFQNWFSEKQLESSGAIQHAIATLEKSHYLYKKDDAVWLNSTQFW